ncbi:hypothetical protein QBC45DRAFT_237008 [Copromyces sp. CBS 386.78]|nr:hypothetical protein QBC45DRAFT_237008 [Copromyces sp. CBS 386.78]
MSTSLSARGGPGTVAGWRGHTTVGLARREDRVGISGCDSKAMGEDEYEAVESSGSKVMCFRTPQLTGCKKRQKSRARHGDGGPSLPEMAELSVRLDPMGLSWRRPTSSCCQSPWSRETDFWSGADGAISGRGSNRLDVRCEVPIEGGGFGCLLCGSRLLEVAR